MSQRSFDSAEYAMKKKRTRREKFLGEMERTVPWARRIAVIEPLYPTSGRVGRQPIGAYRMLRMYCLPQWYGLADEALEDALYDSQALRDFIGVDLSRESVPDATTLLKFRHLLQHNDLTNALFEEINAHLADKGLLVRAGTNLDATIIATPSSTKNEGHARDPQMHQTKKGNQTSRSAVRCCTAMRKTPSAMRDTKTCTSKNKPKAHAGTWRCDRASAGSSIRGSSGRGCSSGPSN